MNENCNKKYIFSVKAFENKNCNVMQSEVVIIHCNQSNLNAD